MQALLGGHGGGQHVEANGAGQLRLQRLQNRLHEISFVLDMPDLWRHCNLCIICDCFMRRPVQLIQRQIPRFFHNLCHCGQNYKQVQNSEIMVKIRLSVVGDLHLAEVV